MESEAGFLEEPEVTSQELVRNTFQHLFPDSYRDILPVHNHRVSIRAFSSFDVHLHICQRCILNSAARP